MRLLCLPLDHRPCNTLFADRLVSFAGGECVFPRPDESPRGREKAPYEGSLRFLKRELPACDAAVISLDAWCYGGLLASREMDTDTDMALSRLRELQSLLLAHPRVRIYLFSVILRSSVSALSLKDLKVYHAMTDYSVHSDRYDLLGLEEDRLLAEQARQRIPPEILDRVLRVRRRNLQVHLAALDLLAPLARSLTLVQEDCQVYGLPRRDQRVIRSHMKEGNRVFLRNGADECSMVCAMEAMGGGSPLPLQIRYLGAGDFTALYEDRPFRENLESACEQLNLVPDDQSPVCLFVCCPADGVQREASDAPDSPVCTEYARQIRERADAGDRVYVLDVIAANGGSTGLMRALTPAPADGLWGYAAWNTAGNALGTILAQIRSDHLRGERHERFFRERLLDDYVYQTHVRPALGKDLEALGEDVYRLRDPGRAEGMLREKMAGMLPDLWPLRFLPDYRISLPWGRTFEILAEVKDERNES